jgi:hypothetical protein
MMRKIDLDEMLCCLLPAKDRVVVSVSDYMFLAGWEADIFGEICNEEPIASFPKLAENSADEVTLNGYFRLLAKTSDEVIERLARFMSVRLFVCSPRDGFFDDIPPLVRDAIFNRGTELSEAVISAASSLSGFDWMALRDGDEGDAFYYLF